MTKQDNWVKGVLAFFVLVAFFGGYYIGASDMRVSFEIDNNTLQASEHLLKTVEFIEQERELKTWFFNKDLVINNTGNYVLMCSGITVNGIEKDVNCVLGVDIN